jgi:hypothetical protein
MFHGPTGQLCIGAAEIVKKLIDVTRTFLAIFQGSNRKSWSYPRSAETGSTTSVETRIKYIFFSLLRKNYSIGFGQYNANLPVWYLLPELIEKLRGFDLTNCIYKDTVNCLPGHPESKHRASITEYHKPPFRFDLFC